MSKHFVKFDLIFGRKKSLYSFFSCFFWNFLFIKQKQNVDRKKKVFYFVYVHFITRAKHLQKCIFATRTFFFRKYSAQHLLTKYFSAETYTLLLTRAKDDFIKMRCFYCLRVFCKVKNKCEQKHSL